MTPVIAILVHAATFVVPAGLSARILGPVVGASRPKRVEPTSVIAEIGEGPQLVWRQRVPRELTMTGAAKNFAVGLNGSVFLRCVNEEVSFDPELQAMIFAEGNDGSALGAAIPWRLP